jgi:hypothetical protein
MSVYVDTRWLEPDAKPAAPRAHPEAELQRAVHQFLTQALPSDAVHFAIPNGLMRSKKAAARARGEGVRAGVPDIEIIWRGQPLFLELKAARGVMSKAQRDMARTLTYCGADVVCCRSLACVQSSLIELGVPLKATVAA